MSTEYKILGRDWYSTRGALVGIIAVETFENQWRAYMSVVKGQSQREDEQTIATYGSPLPEEVARAYFSLLKEMNYKN